MAVDLSLRKCVGVSLALTLLHISTLAMTFPRTSGVSVEVTGSAHQSTQKVREHMSLVRSDATVTPLPPKPHHRNRIGATDLALSGVTPSRSALLKRRAIIHRVPGHTALPSMMEVEVDSGGQVISRLPSCDECFEKARLITAHYNATHPDDLESKGPSGQFYTLHQRILASLAAFSKGLLPTKDPANLAAFSSIMDTLTLSDGQAGVVWTITDATTWDCCNTDDKCTNEDGTNPLEASRHGPDDLEQGDELNIGNGTLFMLIEGAVHHKRVVESTWPKTGSNTHEIAYCFTKAIDSKAREAIQAAVLHIEEQVPCLKFKAVGVQDGNNDFQLAAQENCEKIPSIIIQSHQSGCFSPVGYISGRQQFAGMSQPVNVGKGCEDMGIAAHELGHAIGMLHEMSREDATKWVDIKEANIPANQMQNFKAYSSADQQTLFDYNSLMMYGSYAFSTTGELTIVPHDLRLVSFMGQRMGFSELDIELIGSTYGCIQSVTPKTRDKSLSQAYLDGKINTGFEGKCVDSERTGYVRKDDSPMPCSELKRYCAHDTLGTEVKQLCPVSCYLCQTGLNGTETVKPGGTGGSPTPGPPDPDGKKIPEGADKLKNGAVHVHSRPYLLGFVLSTFAVLMTRLHTV